MTTAHTNDDPKDGLKPEEHGTPTAQEQEHEEPTAKKTSKMWILWLLLALAIVVGGMYLFAGKSSAEDKLAKATKTEKTLRNMLANKQYLVDSLSKEDSTLKAQLAKAIDPAVADSLTTALDETRKELASANDEITAMKSDLASVKEQLATVLATKPGSSSAPVAAGQGKNAGTPPSASPVNKYPLRPAKGCLGIDTVNKVVHYRKSDKALLAQAPEGYKPQEWPR